jgi:hypothetical protein
LNATVEQEVAESNPTGLLDDHPMAAAISAALAIQRLHGAGAQTNVKGEAGQGVASSPEVTVAKVATAAPGDSQVRPPVSTLEVPPVKLGGMKEPSPKVKSKTFKLSSIDRNLESSLKERDILERFPSEVPAVNVGGMKELRPKVKSKTFKLSSIDRNLESSLKERDILERFPSEVPAVNVGGVKEPRPKFESQSSARKLSQL